MGSNRDLNANSKCLSSTGDLVLDKAVNQWMAWDKVRIQPVLNILTLTLWLVRVWPCWQPLPLSVVLWIVFIMFICCLSLSDCAHAFLNTASVEKLNLFLCCHDHKVQFLETLWNIQYHIAFHCIAVPTWVIHMFWLWWYSDDIRWWYRCSLICILCCYNGFCTIVVPRYSWRYPGKYHGPWILVSWNIRK